MRTYGQYHRTFFELYVKKQVTILDPSSNFLDQTLYSKLLFNDLLTFAFVFYCIVLHNLLSKTRRGPIFCKIMVAQLFSNLLCFYYSYLPAELMTVVPYTYRIDVNSSKIIKVSRYNFDDNDILYWKRHIF